MRSVDVFTTVSEAVARACSLKVKGHIVSQRLAGLPTEAQQGASRVLPCRSRFRARPDL